MIRSLSGLVIFSAILLVSSCATVPPQPKPDTWFSILPEKSDIYFFLRKEEMTDIIDGIIDGTKFDSKDVRFVISKTNIMYGSVITGDENKENLVSLVALGSYPRGMMNLQLWMNSAWKNRGETQKYWYNKSEDIELWIPSSDVLMISQGFMSEMERNYSEPRYLVIPEKLKSDMNSADFIVYVPGVSEGKSIDSSINPALKKSNIPINALWFSMKRKDADFLVGADFIMPTEKQARLFSFVFRLVLTAWLRSEKVEGIAEKLKGVKISSNGNNVDISGLVLPTQNVLAVALKFMGGSEARSSKIAEEKPKKR